MSQPDSTTPIPADKIEAAQHYTRYTRLARCPVQAAAAPDPRTAAQARQAVPRLPALPPHAAGVWAKKIRGKLYYFGAWEDPDAALANYLAEKDDLHADRKPRPDSAAVTVGDVCNSFLNHKRDLRDNDKLSPRTWAQYKETCDLLAYLRERLPTASAPRVVVLDNAGIPTSKVVKAARPGLARQGIYLYYLPAYSPELNRIEPVFKQVKHHDMPVRSYTSKAELRKAVEDGFNSYRRRLQPKGDSQPRLAA